MAMMAMTTSSSIKVKPDRFFIMRSSTVGSRFAPDSNDTRMVFPLPVSEFLLPLHLPQRLHRRLGGSRVRRQQRVRVLLGKGDGIAHGGGHEAGTAEDGFSPGAAVAVEPQPAAAQERRHPQRDRHRRD